MLSNPATQSKNPKDPVTRLPTTNTFTFHSEVAINSAILAGSPWSNTNGASRMAEPAFVQYASWMVEFLQYDRDDLTNTEWTAMESEENTPKTRLLDDGIDDTGRLPSGMTPMKNPMVTRPAAIVTRVAWRGWNLVGVTAMVKGKTRPLAIWGVRLSWTTKIRKADEYLEKCCLDFS
jgi:hypothetical protein